MDEEIDRLVVSVRADTRAFASDVATMRAELDGPFADGLERAGAALERGLVGAIQRGKFGFEDLRRVALSALSEIASAALRSGLDSLGGGAQGAGAAGVAGPHDLATGFDLVVQCHGHVVVNLIHILTDHCACWGQVHCGAGKWSHGSAADLHCGSTVNRQCGSQGVFG